jgi:membrane fusion protein, peptide pheromone/bacteriocin exporter
LVIYFLVLLAMGSCMLVLPVIYIDISIKTPGVVRPQHERTEIRSLVSGIIDSILYKEGEYVSKEATLIRIRNPAKKNKQQQQEFEIAQREPFIHDLKILLSEKGISQATISLLTSPLYQQQAARFIVQKSEYEASFIKAGKEMEIGVSLAKDKVISPKELFDLKIGFEKTQSVYHSFIQDQLSRWQQDLVNYTLAIAQFRQEVRQTDIDASYYTVKAPVAGFIQGINTRYAGGLLQANETICSISPQENLVGECYVSSKDMGLLHTGQPARFQFEAFDYNYFGVMTGKITRIDNDFILLDNKPVFKVSCSFDSLRLRLRNGFAGEVKKGLGFQAGFVVTRRSLWQLLFDHLDDWLNPNAIPPKENLTH